MGIFNSNFKDMGCFDEDVDGSGQHPLHGVQDGADASSLMVS